MGFQMNKPTCPKCSYEFDEEETWHSGYNESGEVFNGDGDESELVCPNLDCKSPFTVVCNHHISWDARDE